MEMTINAFSMLLRLLRFVSRRGRKNERTRARFRDRVTRAERGRKEKRVRHETLGRRRQTAGHKAEEIPHP